TTNPSLYVPFARAPYTANFGWSCRELIADACSGRQASRCGSIGRTRAWIPMLDRIVLLASTTCEFPSHVARSWHAHLKDLGRDLKRQTVNARLRSDYGGRQLPRKAIIFDSKGFVAI